MSLDLANYDVQAREAVKLFWSNRAAALARQVKSFVTGFAGHIAAVASR